MAMIAMTTSNSIKVNPHQPQRARKALRRVASAAVGLIDTFIVEASTMKPVLAIVNWFQRQATVGIGWNPSAGGVVQTYAWGDSQHQLMRRMPGTLSK